jgi:hypothetical protein
MKKKIRVFILDDSFPKPKKFINDRIYERAIGAQELSYLARNCDWGAEWNLRKLTNDLLANEYVKSGRIELGGYLNPAICLAELDRRRLPDVVVYDWEYEANAYTKSETWLLELLGEIPKAFIFVYTGVKNDVPPHLSKRVFDKFAPRFQLFAKGESNNSVFTSEDFIYQYIVSRVEKNNTIKLQGIDVKFEPSGYLATPSDILHLETILGRANLLRQIELNKNTVSAESVEKMITDAGGVLWFNPDKGFLVTRDSPLLAERLRASVEISYVEILKKFGLLKLKEAMEVGFARV